MTTVHCTAALNTPHSACHNSFKEKGIVKVHWETWSDCNLGCAFCYRSIATPLTTAKAKKLLSALSWCGVNTVVFAGGDPTLRKDLPELISFAAKLLLKVEVQTNAHFLPHDTEQSLLSDDVDLIGL
ncbi:MAG: radical SAM protein [Corynebacterium glutamicum]|nr:radical SAM protein [Corynebacterium glutamicum]